MTIEWGPTAGRVLRHRASDSSWYDTATLEPDFSLLKFGTTGSACHDAHLESGTHLSRPAGDRGLW